MGFSSRLQKLLFAGANAPKDRTLADFSAEDIDGRRVDLGAFAGKVVVVANVASYWGLTDQNYQELQLLYEKYGAEGFEVLAFPCNQFGNQEPGTNAQIKKFAAGKGAQFPLFAKVDVNGEHAHPLFKYLKAAVDPGLTGRAVPWNFAKFLIDRRGLPVRRFAPTTAPLALSAAIERLLAEPVPPRASAGAPAGPMEPANIELRPL